jgi:transposase
MTRTKQTRIAVVGLDIAKEKVDACFLDEQENVLEQQVYPKEKYRALVKNLKKAKPGLVVMEATGGYEKELAVLFLKAGVPYRILNPARTRHFAAAIGLHGKTDPVDARMLALYALRNRLEPGRLPTESERQLRELLDRRRQLVEMRTAEKNREGRSTHPGACKSVKEVLTLLEAQIADVDRQLDAEISGDDEFRGKEDILTSVPGVGKQTARVLLSSLPELGELDRREVASLAGLAPYARDSGRHRGVRHIFGGRKVVRCALYMAAISAIRYNPCIRALHERLTRGGKKFKVSITACMRKLLVILNALLKNKVSFSA